MQFLYEEVINGKNKVIVMEHNDERLEWSVEGYRKLTPNIYVFGDINRALDSISADQQDRIWAAYKQIQEDFLNISDISRLDKRIIQSLKEIEQAIPYAVVQKQVIQDGDFWIPPDPKDSEVMPEVNLGSFDVVNPAQAEIDEQIKHAKNTKNLTYTLYDYEQLNILIIYSKLYLPVLSAYSNILKDDIPEIFKCTKTMDLLDELQITQEEGWTRLANYIDHFWVGRKKQDGLNPAVLLKGMSDELVLTWLQANLVYKRLLPIGVSHRSQQIPDKERPNFIKGLFHVVEGLAKDLTSGNKSEYFMNKSAVKLNESEEDQSSKLENYRTAAEIQEVALLPVQIFCENIDNILKHVDPTLPRELVDSVTFSRRYHTSEQPLRDRLIQYVLGKVISPKVIHYLDIDGTGTQTHAAYANCFKVTYALLVHWGFDELARLLDSKILFEEPREMIFNNLDFTPEQVKKIREFYPHEIEQNRAKSESKRNSSYPLLACTDLQDKMKGYTLYSYREDKRYICHVDIQYQVAALLIYMNEHQFI